MNDIHVNRACPRIKKKSEEKILTHKFNHTAKNLNCSKTTKTISTSFTFHVCDDFFRAPTPITIDENFSALLYIKFWGCFFCCRFYEENCVLDKS